jgi:hypothetical protein
MSDTTTAATTEQATASSAHSRINVPLNMENWRDLDEGTQEVLTWFHQYLLDNGLDWEDATEAIGYDRSTVFRVLKGSYEGSYANVVKSIKSFQRIAEQRGAIVALACTALTVAADQAAKWNTRGYLHPDSRPWFAEQLAAYRTAMAVLGYTEPLTDGLARDVAAIERALALPAEVAA